MPEINATILIPDISGFTEFMTNTELTHGTHAIDILMNAMLKAIEDEYEVSEIEGDAVLLIKKGPAPSPKEIQETCLKIFNAFHFQRKWLQQHAICPCGACLSINDLTLKFVAHHGQIAETKIGRFVKQSGPEMIVAHRLLKNSIDNNEYMLITEKLLQHSTDSPDIEGLEWSNSSEEYPSIGKIDYRFALLNEARKKTPVPPEPESYYRTDKTPFVEIPVAAHFRDVYMILMNIPVRSQWVPGLQTVEQDMSDVFIGSIHHCRFENFKTIVSPLRMTLSEDAIIFAESCRIEELNLSLVHEYIFKKVTDKTSVFSYRVINMADSSVPEEIKTTMLNNMKAMAEKLKDNCEKMETSLFEPAFQKNKIE